MPLVALALVVAAAGCGQDDSSTADYRDRASELCADVEREGKRIAPPRNGADWERFWRDSLEFSRDYTAWFEALEPPTSSPTSTRNRSG